MREKPTWIYLIFETIIVLLLATACFFVASDSAGDGVVPEIEPYTTPGIPWTMLPEKEEPPYGTIGLTEPIPETDPESSVTEVQTETEIETEIEFTERPSYAYAGQVPSCSPKDSAALDNALFIGDSRMVGFCTFTGRTHCYAQVSLTLQTVMTNAFLPDENGVMHTAPEMMAKHVGEFDRVYLLFGLNEYGWDGRVFEARYKTLIEKIRNTLGEDVPIYLMTEYPIDEIAAHRKGYTVRNSQVLDSNDRIASVAENTGVYLINTAEALLDGDRFSLPSGCANDGIHLNKQMNQKVLEYILSHDV